jgi:SOS-response transcriptional repressor LexA
MTTDYGKRLRSARKFAGLTQEGLSKITGIAQSTISTAERLGHGSGETPVYAKACGVDAHWLATGEGLMQVKIATANVSNVSVRATVPLISRIQAGAFQGIEDMYLPGEAEEFIEVFETSVSGNAFALRVEGDSMLGQHPGSASFPAGTIIIVDPQRSANAGDYVVAKDVSTQQATFKRLAHDAGRWYLRPLNPAYPTIEIDDPAVRVIGRVVEFRIGGKL